MKSCLIIALMLIANFGCTSPANRQTAVNYNTAAFAALKAGDWATARLYFAHAIDNAKLGGMNIKGLALLWYEYGRTSGVICDWAEAERGLNEAYKFDSDNGGPAFMSLYELGRMYHDRKLHAKAVDYFSKVKVEFDNMQADTRDPLGYADYLEEFATSLSYTGNSVDADKFRARATELRNAFPGKIAHTKKTPYGTQCNAIPSDQQMEPSSNKPD